MSEEVATMGMSLEHEPEMVAPGAPPAAEAPATPPQEPAASPAPAPVAEDPEPEGTIGAANGVKYAPIGAVLSEREKRKEERRLREAAEQERDALRQKAQAYDETKGYIEQARPYIEALRADKTLVQRLQQPQEPAGPLSEAEAVEHAKALDLYTTDGKPDTARAQAIAKMYSGIAAKQAQQMVAPLVQTEAQRQATALYQQAAQMPEVNGFKIDPKFLAEAWQVVPPELIAANPQVAELMKVVAAGRQVLSGQKPTQAPPPPIVSESVGAGKPAEATLTADSERFLKAAGMKRDTFMETRNAYKPGQHNNLE